jgi:hypothetical protein
MTQALPILAYHLQVVVGRSFYQPVLLQSVLISYLV